MSTKDGSQSRTWLLLDFSADNRLVVQNLCRKEVIENIGNHPRGQAVSILTSRAKGLFSGRNNHSFIVNADLEDN